MRLSPPFSLLVADLYMCSVAMKTEKGLQPTLPVDCEGAAMKNSSFHCKRTPFPLQLSLHNRSPVVGKTFFRFIFHCTFYSPQEKKGLAVAAFVAFRCSLQGYSSCNCNEKSEGGPSVEAEKTNRPSVKASKLECLIGVISGCGRFNMPVLPYHPQLCELGSFIHPGNLCRSACSFSDN
jgi:hypothetical protein